MLTDFQLADFGLALPIPAQVCTQAQWNAWAPVSQFNWTHDVLWRNTEHYIPPVCFLNVPNPRSLLILSARSKYIKIRTTGLGFALIYGLLALFYTK